MVSFSFACSMIQIDDENNMQIEGKTCFVGGKGCLVIPEMV